MHEMAMGAVRVETHPREPGATVTASCANEPGCLPALTLQPCDPCPGAEGSGHPAQAWGTTPLHSGPPVPPSGPSLQTWVRGKGGGPAWVRVPPVRALASPGDRWEGST